MYACTRLQAGVVHGTNRAAYATEGPTEGGGGSTQVALDAGPTTMTARARLDCRWAAVVVVCCPPWTRVTIRHQRFFRREEEEEDNDG